MEIGIVCQWQPRHMILWCASSTGTLGTLLLGLHQSGEVKAPIRLIYHEKRDIKGSDI